ncbi:hypothetical protein AB1Y20_013352 [Prymnesium parvum]|uniref:Uncharacterized protein n=1 Tax=Prymnesium parvum TaxID=97485 RepID=A0AB34IN60_PRYPA
MRCSSTTAKCAVLSLLLTLLLIYRQTTSLPPVYLLDGRPGGAAAAYLAADIGESAVRLARAVGVTKLANAACQNGHALPQLLRRVSSSRAQQWAAARAYFWRQRPHVLRAAAEFELHPYWPRATNGTASFEALVGERAAAMAAALAADGRDDFVVEKDKCLMYAYLRRHCLPLAPVLRTWRGSPAEVRAALLGMAADGGVAWPLYLKMCHLTQGPEDSVRQLRSAAWTARHIDDVEAFVASKWARRAHDADRFLANAMDAITSGLRAGAMAQAAFSSPAELKVLVLWGRVYVAYVMAELSGVLTREGLFERGCRACCVQQQALPTPLAAVPELAWIARERQLPRAWLLAETAAAAMGADQVRIDIFLRKGAPAALVVNEISLHTGAPLHFHAEFAALLWSQTGRYKRYPAEGAWRRKVAGAALHQLGVGSAVPPPNLHAVLRGLHEMKAWGDNHSARIAQCLGSKKPKPGRAAA